MPTAGPHRSGQELRPLNPQIIITVRAMPTPPIATRCCAPAIRAAVRAPIAEAAADTTSKVSALSTLYKELNGKRLGELAEGVLLREQPKGGSSSRPFCRRDSTSEATRAAAT